VFGFEIPEENKGCFLSPEKSILLSNSNQSQSEESGQKPGRRPKQLEIQTEDTPESTKGSNSSNSQISGSKNEPISQTKVPNPVLANPSTSKFTTNKPADSSTGQGHDATKGKKKEDCVIF